MTLTRDIGDGPHSAFGSALSPKLRGEIEMPPLITERPRRLQGDPPCPVCGERIFYCGEHEGEIE